MLDASTAGGSPLTQLHRQVTGAALSCWARMRSWMLQTWSAPTRWTGLSSWSDRLHRPSWSLHWL